MVSAKIAILLAAAAGLVAGVFIASPDIRAYAAATIGSADIIDETIRSVDIKNGEVKASDLAANSVTDSELAANSVGASELKGVTRLIFGDCSINAFSSTPPGNAVLQNCGINGVVDGDNVVVTKNGGNGCFKIVTATANAANNIFIIWRNDCSTSQTLGTGEVSVIAFN
ncbi:MAG TPA: hypothetical protein VJL54_01030 [Nitrososphaera sp.]|nr:hypothetical protein [Nitrososphaera sp.]